MEQSTIIQILSVGSIIICGIILIILAERYNPFRKSQKHSKTKREESE